MVTRNLYKITKVSLSNGFPNAGFRHFYPFGHKTTEIEPNDLPLGWTKTIYTS